MSQQMFQTASKSTYPIAGRVLLPLEDGALLVGVAVVLGVALVGADRQRGAHLPRRPHHSVLQALEGVPVGYSL